MLATKTLPATFKSRVFTGIIQGAKKEMKPFIKVESE